MCLRAAELRDDASPENCAKLIADANSLIADSSETLQHIYSELA